MARSIPVTAVERGPTGDGRRNHTRSHVDAGRLANDLHQALDGEVRFDPGSRALYATDASNYRQTPIGVVIPRSDGDIVRAMEICRTHRAPVFGRGGGTSLAGQCCNVAVCFDLSKYMNHVVSVDSEHRLADVEPGTILDDLRHAAEPHGLTFGPDPATHDHCTLGGMIGNNSCGVHSVMAQFYGPGPRTSDNVESLDVLTYDGIRLRVGATSTTERQRLMQLPGRRGDIFRRLHELASRYEADIRNGMPQIPRRVSGFNLTALLPENGFNVAHALVGSESACVMVLGACLRLIPNPTARSLVVLGYPSVFDAADHVLDVMRHKPVGCEGLDDRLLKDIEAIGYEKQTLELLPEGQGWLLVEFGGETRAEAESRARDLITDLADTATPPAMKLFDDPAQASKIWKVREAGLGATAHVSRERPTWAGWEDSAVPPDRLGEYLRRLRSLLERHQLHGDLYGHFGQGCVHTRIDFDLQTEPGVRNYRSFVEAAADLVASLGGSLSGEHGDGQSRGELLSRMYSPQLMQAFREFKSIWDPEWRMNPGKVIDADPLDQHLRLGPSYDPPQLQTHFQYPNELGGFAKATLRCVGVGKCRRLEGGTMCPSFMVTREEKHSTRGRARLLFEMLLGDPLQGGWQNEHVKDALDLCLACKGCKADCPVGVDMAAYKSEFLSHYHEGHRRPVSAYAFGFVHNWARLGSVVPSLTNFLTQTPGLAGLARLVSGTSRFRKLPAFAPFTFTQWFAHRPRQHGATRGRVVLWPDTFNNHFHPHTAIHAVHALERLGYAVEVPAAPLCCGRPLYDYGFLDTAKSWLLDILSALREQIDAGVPVVGLEPSCVTVFRDEMTQLLPNVDSATRLAGQTFLLSEFLQREEAALPKLHRTALVHGHCHHKAILRFEAEEEMLSGMGLECRVLDSGCCGMAGAFGFEREHYDISMKVGERVLLPAVRAAANDTLIVADGFSCRTQIAQATRRRALHLADVIEMAAREGVRGPAGDRPEQEYVPEYGTQTPAAKTAAAVLLTAGLGTAVYALARRR